MRPIIIFFCSSLWLATALLAGCDKPAQSAAPPSPSSAATSEQYYQAKGVVVSVKPQQKKVEIRHEAIAGYMDAMTMPFEVKDTNELAGLEPGSPVTFRLVITPKEGWIDQINKLGVARTNAVPLPGPGAALGADSRIVRDVEPLNLGDALPEYHLTNQFGKAFSTADFKGGPLAITFLFTRCPFPNFCPRMANNFSEAQQKLLQKTNAPAKWYLLTVSFDPEVDKPEVLKTYSAAYKCDPKHWTFATGSVEDVTALGEQFGLQFWRSQDNNALINHNLRTVILDGAGRVRRVLEGNSWTSDELVAEIKRAGG
jgi:protein SCO1/2